MNTIHPLIFPNALISQWAGATERFHGVPVPSESGPRNIYYQGLPCAGWTAREICRQRSDVKMETAVQTCLEALRRHAYELSAAAPDDVDFEAKVIERFQRDLATAFPEVKLTPPDRAVPGESGSRRPIVLVVDDCPVTRLLITRQLQLAGLDATAVTDGAEALLQAGVHPPHLVLMDVNMELIGGVQACALLKRSGLTGRPPVIFLSASSDKAAIAEGFEAGGADYIAKPFDPREGLARVRAHLELRQLQLQMESTNQQLRRANLAKDRLLGVTTHDLRNPLTTIRGMAQLLENGSLGTVNGKQAETLRCVAGAAERMMLLVNDLLDIATLDEGTIKLNRSRKDLGQVARVVEWIFATGAMAKGIQVQLDVPEGPLACECDEVRVQRVLENLVGNAVKFSPAGSIIRLGARREGDWVRVWVDDEGPGIPATEQGKLFTDYGRTSVQPTGGESTTGLGLAICRRIITAHGGSIGMRNRPEGGAHFEFILPVDLPAAAGATADRPIAA